MKTDLCRQCMRPIQHDGTFWIHSEWPQPRHPAQPRIQEPPIDTADAMAEIIIVMNEAQTPKPAIRTWRKANRRDRCAFVSSRAKLVAEHQAAAAWRELADLVDTLSHQDIPKFNDLLAAIRTATVRGHAPACARCRHWRPVAEWFGQRNWGECQGFKGESRMADSFTHASYTCHRYAPDDPEARMAEAAARYNASFDQQDTPKTTATNALGRFPGYQPTVPRPPAAPTPKSAQAVPQETDSQTPKNNQECPNVPN